MKGTFALFDIAGHVALLLWGMHMVTSGALRGYGSALRRWLGATSAIVRLRSASAWA